ncbi:Uncharacterized protein DBV15_12526, partial [Temnothorax longispinosus]
MARKKINEKTVKETAKKKKKSASGQYRRAVAKKKRSEKNYSVETLQAALNATGEGLTLRQVAHSFGVPKSTLFFKLKYNSPLECRKGPKTVLSAEEENEIASWIVFCADSGFPVNKTRLLDCVQKYFNNNKAKTPFKNNRPGQHWYRAFMNRHPNLSTRIAQNLTSTRAAVTEVDLRNWFAKVKQYLDTKNLLHIEPHRVFNLDESAFMLVPKDNKVITEKGVKAPYQIVSGNEKASLTILFTVAASGVMPPPMILFDLKTSPKKNVLDQIPRGWGVENTERGWMTGESFYSYISNVFYKWLQENNYVFPIILYVDGHSLHMTLPLLKFCKEHLIELVVLYPNATHIIQPLDVAVFHPLKDSYRKVLRQWRIDNNVVDVKKHMFAPVLKMALESYDLTDAVKNGFRACGLYPFNADAVNYNVLSKKSKKKDASINLHSTNNSDQDSIIKNTELLAMFEKNVISPDIVESFKQAESENKWNGDVKYVALYESWLKLKKLCSEMHDVPSNEALTVENSLPADQPIPNADLIDMATNTASGATDEIMLDVSSHSDNQLDLSVINVADENSLDMSYAITPSIEQNTLAELPVAELIELYDELGNRVTATVIAINDDVTMSSDSSPSSADTRVDSQLVPEEKNKDDLDKTDSEEFNSDSNRESSSSHCLNISNKDDVLDFTITSEGTNESENTVNTEQEDSHDSVKAPVQTDTLEKTSPVFGTSVLSKHNSINVINDNNSHLSIDEESNSSTCGSKNDIQISPKLQEFFPVPTFTKKRKKSTSKNTPTVAVVDDLLIAMQQKEAEKKEKGQQILLNKQEREKAKTIRDKETTIVKQYNENKKKKIQKKKELKLQIQNLKKAIKSENSKENVGPLTERLQKVNAELAELENSLIL